MIKYILIVSFLLVSAASIFGWLDIGFDSFSEASNILEQKELKDKIKVPAGMEKEYEAVLARNVEVKKEQDIKNPSQAVATNKNQISEKEAKQQAQDFLNPNKNTDASNSEIKTKTQIQKIDQKLMTKVVSLFVKNDNLIFSMKIHNPKEIDFNDIVTITCTAKNNQNKPVDVFSWSGKLSIPSKKTILLQEANFGYINISEEVNISCKIE